MIFGSDAVAKGREIRTREQETVIIFDSLLMQSRYGENSREATASLLPIASLPIASLPIASLPIASLPIASLPIAK
ncbi:hypothetical protein [Moorena sp. SIO4G3]|uniref:hypothetical protein n=1 Tax=Moorena sp. SIO4G3 TaxID=2607821 RepID=UPI00142B3F1E|nr:hypothetical protein [Moorena sp. SIO4G3]NEO80720.1 hypothetical protein [Moorena sp. SIO4G3]